MVGWRRASMREAAKRKVDESRVCLITVGTEFSVHFVAEYSLYGVFSRCFVQPLRSLNPKSKAVWRATQ